MDPTLYFCESDTESEIFCQEIKNTAIQESVVKNMKIPEIPKQKPRELAYRMNQMQVQNLEKAIFIGDSAATSHMKSDMIGLYSLQKISGSVMLGNGQNIRCTHQELLDVICIQKNGSTVKDTWEIKMFPRLNHDLFSFTSAMKSGWQMNGRWKKNGIEIELFKRGHGNFRFDRLIPSIYHPG